MTYEEAVQAIPAGRYRHFKGNDYEVVCIAKHSEDDEPVVVYRALYGDYGIWVRPAKMWHETVIRDGVTYRRFYRLDRIRRVERYEGLFQEALKCPEIEKVRLLQEYYASGEWQDDHDADQNGELPPSLKRDVLSPEAISGILAGFQT